MRGGVCTLYVFNKRYILDNVVCGWKGTTLDSALQGGFKLRDERESNVECPLGKKYLIPFFVYEYD